MTDYTQLAAWIIVHRQNKAFRNYTLAMIVQELTTCDIATITNGHGNVVGIACGKPNKEKKEMYIYDVLTTHKKAFRRLLEYFKDKYPNYTLKGKRKSGKEIAYNVDDLLKRIH